MIKGSIYGTHQDSCYVVPQKLILNSRFLTPCQVNHLSGNKNLEFKISYLLLYSIPTALGHTVR